jgi:glycine oxidase
VRTRDVIVGGGGIIGLSIALELARSGRRVTILEKGRLMREASWAAAGMLAGHDPEHPAALAALAILSEQLYPQFLQTVEELSGQRVPLRTRKAWVAMAGTAAWSDEASLDPRDLCAALPQAAMAAGVEVHEETAVLAVAGGDRSVTVETSRGSLQADAYVNCCGAWAEGVEPYKGQMLSVRLPQHADLDYVIRSPEVYLVPRGEGLVVIGATVERVGFDRRVEPATLERLRAQAAALWPAVATAPMVESWSGLRPGTEDGLPLIGRTEQPRCWTATGHFRNGILLAPATALVMRQLLQGETPAVSLDAFAPRRLAVTKVP